SAAHRLVSELTLRRYRRYAAAIGSSRVSHYNGSPSAAQTRNFPLGMNSIHQAQKRAGTGASLSR
ncbi:hypothetical protein, partial [Bergeriella denitrificans]|uniref:hypothetical protein n=1 Tax=Bergeriella denitrificans TaxID=494 RepID=UPI001C3FC93D